MVCTTNTTDNKTVEDYHLCHSMDEHKVTRKLFKKFVSPTINFLQILIRLHNVLILTGTRDVSLPQCTQTSSENHPDSNSITVRGSFLELG